MRRRKSPVSDDKPITRKTYELTDIELAAGVGSTAGYHMSYLRHAMPAYRIRAIVDIPRFGVKKGDLGGYVEGYHNLKDGAWVGGDAVIRGQAEIGGRAFVFGKATVTDHAMIRGKSMIFEQAHIGGHVQIGGSSIITGNVTMDVWESVNNVHMRDYDVLIRRRVVRARTRVEALRAVEAAKRQAPTLPETLEIQRRVAYGKARKDAEGQS